MKQLLLYTCLFISLVSCAQKSNTKADANSFEKQINAEGIQLLDVRTMQEYNRGHIKGAMQANWNNNTEFADRTAHLNKEKTVYVYCQAGGRSAAAADYLASKGYTVVDLTGGMIAWQKQSKPVEGVAATVEYTKDDFNKLIADTSKTYLVDIGATWCPPCVKMKPTIDALIKEKGSNFSFINIDAGVHINLQKELNVESLPAFIIYKNGVEVKRFTGITAKEDLAKAIEGK